VNRLTALTNATFGTHSHLDLLTLTKNRVTRLNSNAFGTTLGSLAVLLVNENGLAAIEPDFFARFPALSWFGAAGNECIEESVEDVTEVEAFGLCFDNWTGVNATTTTEGGSTTTTTDGGEMLRVGLVAVLAAALMLLLL
jgi:hypothetical protein